MPRANRYVAPGQIHHLTQRCHDRQFLLRCAKDRGGYRRRLREAVQSAKASLPMSLGDRRLVEAIEPQVHWRQQMIAEEKSGRWASQEEYGSVFGPEKRPMRHS